MAGQYTIQRNDTLWSIAARNHMTLAQLYQFNPEFKTAAYNGGNMIYAGGKVNLGPSTGGSAGVGAKPAAASTTPKASVPAPKPVVPANRSNVEDTLLKQLQGVPGKERDAYAAITSLFKSYDLASLAPRVLQYLQDGFSSDTITVMLQETPEYRTRFAGNDARKAAGLMALTPAEYLSTEASYRQLLQAGGLDPSFQNRNQYTEWIGKDISPAEIQTRVNLAVQATTNAPPAMQQALTQLGFNVGDMATYFLNDKNPTPILQNKVNQAQIMAAGINVGLPVNAERAQIWTQQGVTQAQAQQGYQHIADLLPTANQLSSIYQNQPHYGQAEAEQEFIGSSGADQAKRESLARQELATFSGQGGVGKDSFKQQSPGATGF